MPIKNLFSKKRDEIDVAEEESYVEVNVMDSDDRKPGKLGIRIEKLSEFSDTDRILRYVRSGSIIFLKIKELKDKDMGELKRAVDKLKKSIIANNGEIVGAEQDWLILAPEYARIER